MAEETGADAEAGAVEDAAPAKSKKKKGGMGGLIIGLVLAIALGAGAAFAVMNGLVPIPGAEEQVADEKAPGKDDVLKPTPSFVALDPLTITIGQPGAPRQLRIALTIETTKHYVQSVEETRPRILDALNTLLRAAEEADLSQPWSLDRLRAQMLRRIRIATDPTAIQDLLITEYVIF